MAIPPSNNSSLARGLRVLLLALGHGEASASALASELDLPLSTVYRYLRTLKEFGLLVEHQGRFGAGDALLSQQPLGLPGQVLVGLARPILEELTRQTGETAVLTTRVGSLVLCLDQTESPHAVRVAFRIGQLLPIYAGAASRVLLAHAPQALIKEVLSAELRPFTPDTPDLQKLTRDLDRIRSRKMAVSRGEFIPGAFAIAVAVLVDGVVPCAVTVAAPEARSTPAWQIAAKRSLQKSALSLGRALTM